MSAAVATFELFVNEDPTTIDASDGSNLVTSDDEFDGSEVLDQVYIGLVYASESN